jgi:hypothetical protein
MRGVRKRLDEEDERGGESGSAASRGRLVGIPTQPIPHMLCESIFYRGILLQSTFPWGPVLPSVVNEVVLGCG